MQLWTFVRTAALASAALLLCTHCGLDKEGLEPVDGSGACVRATSDVPPRVAPLPTLMTPAAREAALARFVTSLPTRVRVR